MLLPHQVGGREGGGGQLIHQAAPRSVSDGDDAGFAEQQIETDWGPPPQRRTGRK